MRFEVLALMNSKITVFWSVTPRNQVATTFRSNPLLPFSGYRLRCKVLVAVDIKVTVSWTVTPYNLVETYERFGGTRCNHVQYVKESVSFHAWGVDIVLPLATSPTFRGT
jgi:hypothetical protein